MQPRTGTNWDPHKSLFNTLFLVNVGSHWHNICSQQQLIPTALYAEVSSKGRNGSFDPNIQGCMAKQYSSRGIKPIRYTCSDTDSNGFPSWALVIIPSMQYDTTEWIKTRSTCRHIHCFLIHTFSMGWAGLSASPTISFSAHLHIENQLLPSTPSDSTDI